MNCFCVSCWSSTDSHYCPAMASCVFSKAYFCDVYSIVWLYCVVSNYHWVTNNYAQLVILLRNCGCSVSTRGWGKTMEWTAFIPRICCPHLSASTLGRKLNSHLHYWFLMRNDFFVSLANMLAISSTLISLRYPQNLTLRVFP